MMRLLIVLLLVGPGNAQCTTHNSAYSDDGPEYYAAAYLDRHTLECAIAGTGATQFVRTFHVGTSTDTIRFETNCCDIIDSVTSSTFSNAGAGIQTWDLSTAPSDSGGNRPKYMDRHTLDCGTNSRFLTKFRVRTDSSKMWFDTPAARSLALR
jgi:hypothetical protein